MPDLPSSHLTHYVSRITHYALRITDHALPCIKPLALLAPLLLAGTLSVQAQWLTQTNILKPGWNAVFLHVDASHVRLADLITGANPLAEIWLWQPAVSTAQFTTSPQQATTNRSQWTSWDRALAGSASLLRLVGNAAYLVRSTNTTDYVWTIKGKPVPPRYQWTSTGLNFLGFPAPASSPPTFDKFLLPAPELSTTAEIYRYRGGDLGTTNPVRVSSMLFRSTPVTRGQAFWIRSGTTYNRYYGPVEVSLQNQSGVDFGDNLGACKVRLKNLTSTNLAFKLSLVASEPPPSGQPSQVGTPPLLVRGALNATNLSYAYTNLANPQSFTLAPQGQDGATLEVVLGLDRSAMTQPAGSLYAGVARFTDTAGLSQIDVPVTATVADTSGLWVGNASITQVGQYLKTYAKITNVTVATSAATNEAALANAVASLNLPAPDSEMPGAAWTPQAGAASSNLNWFGLAVSADGTKQVAAVGGGQIYTSTDAGTTWAAREANRNWHGVASSDDGIRLLAADYGGHLYTSTDAGGHVDRS